MKKIIILLPILLLAGACNVERLSNEEVVEQVEICRKADLNAQSVHSYSPIGGDAGIVRIDCEPNK